MTEHHSGCLLCGKPLVYRGDYSEIVCQVCGKTFTSNVFCKDGHYVCDACHGEGAAHLARLICLESESKNPFEILERIFALPKVHMHGPEHHTILASALLAAACNAGYVCDRKQALDVIAERSKNVPGGICGFWGACGAAISAGIFASVVTHASPLTTESWSKCNLLTSAALKSIGEHGGPRCCKRNSLLAAFEAVKFVEKEFGIKMDIPSGIACRHSEQNKECLKKKCPFYSLKQ